MKPVYLPLLLSGCLLTALSGQAQTLFHNVSNLAAGSDNTGDPTFQPGTEVLHSTPGLGVSLGSGGSYEHVGQFYVAANGIWNRSDENGTIGTDYFGYAPSGIGANTAYLGKGIKGASDANGGKGVGRPSFGHLQLNSTSEFPVEGGMLVTHSLRFNANGPGQPNIITTPNANGTDSPLNAVVFAPSALIEGADNNNFINGYASVAGVAHSFTLPLGDPAGSPNSLRPLTINSATTGLVTARYWHSLQHSADALGEGVGSVSPIGNWAISAPAGTSVTVSIPKLDLSPSEASSLRLVGWNGRQWVNLSSTATAGGCGGVDCPLAGVVGSGITDLAIGSISRSTFTKEGSVNLMLWPNPTRGVLQVSVSAGLTIRQLQALDLQGRAVGSPAREVTSLNTASLPTGSYILEVQTSQGQTLRKSFVKQP